MHRRKSEPGLECDHCSKVTFTLFCLSFTQLTRNIYSPLDEVSLSSNRKFIFHSRCASLFLNRLLLANLCMAANSSVNGSPVFITDCSDTSSRKVWSVPQIGHDNSGTYQLSFGVDGGGPVKCLDVTDGQVVPGTKLQLWDCTPDNANQFFTPTTVIRWDITGLVGGLCVDLTDGIQTKGNQVFGG